MAWKQVTNWYCMKCNSFLGRGIFEPPHKCGEENNAWKNNLNQFCSNCKEVDCLISLDDTCEMIRVYLDNKRKIKELLKGKDNEKPL